MLTSLVVALTLAFSPISGTVHGRTTKSKTVHVKAKSGKHATTHRRS